MIVQIRIVVRINESWRNNLHDAITRITDRVIELFPELEAVPNTSPITVTIDEFKEAIDNA